MEAMSKREANQSLLSVSGAYPENQQSLDMVYELIKTHGADINTQLPNGESALNLAAKHGNMNICKLLLDNGANVNYLDHEGSTPLHQAVRFGHVAVCEVLLSHGALSNVQDRNANTPLHHAAYRLSPTFPDPAKGKWVTITHLLIKHGADPDLENIEHKAPRSSSELRSILWQIANEPEPSQPASPIILTPSSAQEKMIESLKAARKKGRRFERPEDDASLGRVVDRLVEDRAKLTDRGGRG